MNEGMRQHHTSDFAKMFKTLSSFLFHLIPVGRYLIAFAAKLSFARWSLLCAVPVCYLTGSRGTFGSTAQDGLTYLHHTVYEESSSTC